MSPWFDADTIVQAKEKVASCALGEGSALLDLEQGQYFSLNPAAAEIWDRVQQPASVGDLIRLLGETFDTRNADLTQDVGVLLMELDRLQLIQIVDA